MFTFRRLNPINLLSTIPRSGTWYYKCTLWCYYGFAKNKGPHEVWDSLKDVLINKQLKRTVGDFYIAHSCHPSAKNVPVFPIPEYNGALDAGYKYKKCVFIHRHKPNQLKSHYDQIKRNNPRLFEMYCKTPEAFEEVAGKCYDMMNATFSDRNSLRIDFHDFMPRQRMYFQKIFNYCGLPQDDAAMGRAIAMTTKFNMCRLEDEMGCSLSGNKGATHIDRLAI